jgi:flavin reductase (DIM6/NTAB) family NADH-FMN oxidoreductase RutF
LSTKDIKSAWKLLPTTVGVLLVTDNNSIHGITINSFFSVSIEFSILAISLSNYSSTKSFIDDNKGFSLSILSCGQESYANFFSKKNKDLVPNNFEFLKNNKGVNYIKDSSVVFFCDPKSAEIVEDHTIIFCKIVDVDFTDNEPLIWKF